MIIVRNGCCRRDNDIIIVWCCGITTGIIICVHNNLPCACGNYCCGCPITTTAFVSGCGCAISYYCGSERRSRFSLPQQPTPILISLSPQQQNSHNSIPPSVAVLPHHTRRRFPVLCCCVCAPLCGGVLCWFLFGCCVVDGIVWAQHNSVVCRKPRREEG